jgi:predicted 2-oxoglutarate/Fe(II)-dependent dioxygenase YbiX
MNNLLTENNYIIIPNFIQPFRAQELAKLFEEYCVENNLEGDSQSPNSYSKYNFINFLELLCEKTPEVSDILGETVVPTYSYARVYKNGSILEKHTDREACEISLTVHLDGDTEWPIYIETPGGETRSISMKPGDAMMYLGRIAPHWRQKFEGNKYTQVFLHYVKSNGENSFAYFDKNTEKVSDEFYQENAIKSNDNANDVFVDCKEFDSIEKNNYSYNISSNGSDIIHSKCNTPLKQFIHVVDNVFSKEFCNEIIREYQGSKHWDDAKIADENAPVNSNVRNCKTLSISSENTIIDNYDYRKKIDSEIFNRISYAVAKYSEIHPDFFIDIDTGYDLLKYDVGNFYAKHTDSFKGQQRSISCSIQLNDDYSGGEFAFFDKEVIIKTNAGSAILFPSNFMFPHEIMPVTEGTRYSIITWLV